LAGDVEPAYGPHVELNPLGEPFAAPCGGPFGDGEDAVGETAGITWVEVEDCSRALPLLPNPLLDDGEGLCALEGEAAAAS